jgi:hypothetical protein
MRLFVSVEFDSYAIFQRNSAFAFVLKSGFMILRIFNCDACSSKHVDTELSFSSPDATMWLIISQNCFNDLSLSLVRHLCDIGPNASQIR